MNINTVAALANTNVTTIKARIKSSRDIDQLPKQLPKPLTFKVTIDFAATINAGDSIVCETVYGLRCATVIEVHQEPQMDPDDGVEYRWAFARIDTSVLDTLKADEQAVVTKAQRARTQGIRQRMQQMLEQGVIEQTPSGNFLEPKRALRIARPDDDLSDDDE